MLLTEDLFYPLSDTAHLVAGRAGVGEVVLITADAARVLVRQHVPGPEG